MNTVLKMVLSTVAIFFIITGSIVAWFIIEISFDGCCGAPQNYGNNGVQILSHLAALLAAIVLIWLIARWGWKRK